jgi:hypothetical protein
MGPHQWTALRTVPAFDAPGSNLVVPEVLRQRRPALLRSSFASVGVNIVRVGFWYGFFMGEPHTQSGFVAASLLGATVTSISQRHRGFEQT